jgi:hypothetical protein
VAYFGIFIEHMHMMRHELIERAEAVGRDPFDYLAAWRPNGYDSHSLDSRSQLVQRMSSVLLGVPKKFKTPIASAAEGSEASAEARERAEANERANHAQVLLRDLSILLHTYPLAKEEGETRSEADFKEQGGWLADANALVEDVSRILQLGGNYARHLLQDATEHWNATLGGARSAVDSDPMSRALNEHFDTEGHPEARYALYTTRLRELRDEIKGVKEALVRYERYASRLPPSGVVWCLFGGALIAFCAGVAYPLIDVHPCRWICVGVPLIVYACGIIAAAVYLDRSYPRQSSDDPTPPAQTPRPTSSG